MRSGSTARVDRDFRGANRWLREQSHAPLNIHHESDQTVSRRDAYLERKKKRKDVIRFSAGSPNHRYSAIWRLWTHGSDVYLGARATLRWLKVSLHESGKWRVAWEQRSGIRAAGSTDRVVLRGERPEEWRPGWTVGPTVIVPWMSTKDPLPLDHLEQLEDVQWFPNARSSNKVMFTVLISGVTASRGDLGTVLREGDRLVGSLPLTNGETVWLSYREDSLTSYEEKHFAEFLADMQVHFEEKPEEFGASLMMLQNSPVGVFTIVDLSLSKANLAVEYPSE